MEGERIAKRQEEILRNDECVHFLYRGDGFLTKLSKTQHILSRFSSLLTYSDCFVSVTVLLKKRISGMEVQVYIFYTFILSYS